MDSSPYRQYGFFEANQIKSKDLRVDVSVEGANKIEAAPLQTRDVTCCMAARGRVIFGDSQGYIYQLLPNMETKRFLAYDGGATRQVWQARDCDVLVSVGDDEGYENGTSTPHVVKCWSLERRDNQGRPALRSCFPVFGERDPGGPSTITSIAGTTDLRTLALGLENGSVLLFSGNIEKGLATKTQLSPQPGSPAPVTALGFHSLSKPSEETVLFVTTTKCVASYNLAHNKRETIIDDGKGAGAGLACVTDSGELAVARHDAVHFYSENEYAGSFIFEGEKELIGWCQGHMVVVSTAVRYAGGQPERSLAVVDMSNRLIAHKQALPKRISRLATVWGSILVFLADGSLLRLTEFELRRKLAVLFRKHMYKVAAELADNAALTDPAARALVHQEWGDHLYDKGDLDGAMKEYLRTIGTVQPSHIIRRYLDASQVYLLAEYLQALHEAPGDLAGEGHTTLMLNCFTRMKDKSRLRAILSGDQHFSVEKAIHACIRADFVEDALELAKAKQLHHMYVDIQIQNRHAYREALEYIWGLSFADVERAVQRDGKALAMALPDETTALLKALCTGYVPRETAHAGSADDAGRHMTGSARVRRASLTEVPTAADGAPFSDAEKYMFIFSGNTQSLMDFLEYVVTDAANRTGRTNQISSSVYNTLLELYLQDGSAIQHLRQSFVVSDPHAEGGHKACYVSPNFIARTGYSREQILGSDFPNFMFQDDTDDTNIGPLVDLAEGMRLGTTIHVKFTQVCRDGTSAPLLMSAVPICDRENDQLQESNSGTKNNEHVLYYVCIFSELPAALNDEAHMEKMIELLNIRQQDLLLIDPNVYGSPIVNMSREFAVNFLGDRQKAINDMIKNSDYIQYLTNHSTDSLIVSQIGEALRMRTQFANARIEKDGQVQLVHCCPVRDETGHVPYFVCLHADITDEEDAVAAAALSSSSMTTSLVPWPLACAADARQRECRAKAQRILADEAARYADDHALILCRQYDFAEGLLFLLEKLQFYNDILEYFMEYSAYSEIIAFAVKRGAEDPTLWMKVVRFFAEVGAAKEMEEVLQILERDKLLSPLQVVQLLGEDESCTVELVRAFLIRTFTALSEEQAEDELAISKSQAEADRIRQATLNGECVVRGEEAAQLDVQVQKLNGKQASGAVLHAEFKTKIAQCSTGLGSNERFGTVAKYFSYGLFDRMNGAGSAAATLDDY